MSLIHTYINVMAKYKSEIFHIVETLTEETTTRIFVGKFRWL